MSNSFEKASGLANEAIGKIKQSVGSAVGSDKLQEEGLAQELKGQAQQVVLDAKALVSEAVSPVEDVVFDVESEIRERAYQIWQQEGSPQGHEHDHWYQAENEVGSRTTAR